MEYLNNAIKLHDRWMAKWMDGWTDTHRAIHLSTCNWHHSSYYSLPAHSTPNIVTSLLFIKNSRYILASGTLYSCSLCLEYSFHQPHSHKPHSFIIFKPLLEYHFSMRLTLSTLFKIGAPHASTNPFYSDLFSYFLIHYVQSSATRM